MRLMPLISAAFALALSEPAFGQEWVEFASTQDRFTCNFPNKPTVAETTYRSEYGADLPARVYSAAQGQSRYSVTVVDYNHSQRILTERAKGCPAGAERCSGGPGVTGEGYWKQDVRGAMLYATGQFLKRDVKVTHLGYNFVDLVEGHLLHLTNSDRSRTFVSIYMHENKLYILEGAVPPGYAEPALFQQSLGWLDENGIGLRYQAIYSNGLPVPPRVKRGPDQGQGRIDADGPGVIKN